MADSGRLLPFSLNGGPVEVVVGDDRLLIDVLREDLGATGTKEGCGIGVCGLCSVLVDGVLLSACLLLAREVEGCQVETVEGEADAAGGLAPLQAAFVEHGGFQCGICTPGQLLAARALLEATPHPTDREVREAMIGNLCRCTGYYGILRAIDAVAASSDR